MEIAQIAFRALAVMSLVGVASCNFMGAAREIRDGYTGYSAFDQGDIIFQVGIGASLLVGAFFLCRAWFVRQRRKDS